MCSLTRHPYNVFSYLQDIAQGFTVGGLGFRVECVLLLTRQCTSTRTTHTPTHTHTHTHTHTQNPLAILRMGKPTACRLRSNSRCRYPLDFFLNFLSTPCNLFSYLLEMQVRTRMYSQYPVDFFFVISQYPL
jgi:hypothetical protein